MRRGRGGSGGGRFARWLLPALGVHGAIGLLAMALSRRGEPPLSLVSHEPADNTASVAPTEQVLELTLLVDDAWAPALAERSSTSSAPESSRGTPLGVSIATKSRGTAGAVAPDSDSDSDSDSATLSLDQLGIGKNPFAIDPSWAPAAAPAPLSPAEQANQRLRASLHQQWFDSDRQRGLGPEGPIVRARRLLVASEDLSETNAVLNIRVDGAGRVTDARWIG